MMILHDPQMIHLNSWRFLALDIVRSRILPRGARHARHAAASNGWPWDVTGFGVGDHGHRKDTEDAVQLSLSWGCWVDIRRFFGGIYFYIYI